MAKREAKDKKVRQNLAFLSGMRGAEKAPEDLEVPDEPDGDMDDEPEAAPRRKKKPAAKKKATPYSSGMRGREADPAAEEAE